MAKVATTSYSTKKQDFRFEVKTMLLGVDWIRLKAFAPRTPPEELKAAGKPWLYPKIKPSSPKAANGKNKPTKPAQKQPKQHRNRSEAGSSSSQVPLFAFCAPCLPSVFPTRREAPTRTKKAHSTEWWQPETEDRVDAMMTSAFRILEEASFLKKAFPPTRLNCRTRRDGPRWRC